MLSIKKIMDSPFYANSPLNSYKYNINEFNNFKANNKKIGKVIYALNNFPDKMFDYVFKEYEDVANNFYTIDLHKHSGPLCKCSELKNMNNFCQTFTYNFDNFYYSYNNFVNDLQTRRYIFIRINIHNTNNNGHVNCIIIDKFREYILFFDSLNNIEYDINKFKDIFHIIEVILGKNFKVINMHNIGYNSRYFSSLQSYDLFCQTYIFLAFLLIINNKKIRYSSYKMLFDNEINSEKLGLFLFFMYNLIKNDDNFKNINYEFYFPGNYLQNIVNTLIFKYKNKSDNNYKNINISDDDIINLD